MPKKSLFTEENIWRVFDVSLWLKGILSFFEIVGGIAAFFVSKQLLLNITYWIMREEFSEDPRDAIANYLLHSVQNISVSAQTFAGFYLLSHGIVKLWLIVGLLRKKLWYYPTALIVFVLFIIYQLYRYSYTHSALLLLLTAFDLIVVVLTWHEYRYLRKIQPRTV